MKISSKRILLIIAPILGTILLIISFAQMYTNNKTDGFGSGTIIVTSCKTDDDGWKIYTCRGNYTANAGEIGNSNVSIRVTGRTYSKGEELDDVYPTYFDNEETAKTFITGEERSSVVYNIPWLIMFFISILLFLWPITRSLRVASYKQLSLYKKIRLMFVRN